MRDRLPFSDPAVHYKTRNNMPASAQAQANPTRWRSSVACACDCPPPLLCTQMHARTHMHTQTHRASAYEKAVTVRACVRKELPELVISDRKAQERQAFPSRSPP